MLVFSLLAALLPALAAPQPTAALALRRLGPAESEREEQAETPEHEGGSRAAAPEHVRKESLFQKILRAEQAAIGKLGVP